jgi:hypothetical protein
MKYVNQSLTIPEILDRITKLETDDEKIKFLSHYVKRNDVIWFIKTMYATDLSKVKYDNELKNYQASTLPEGFNFSKISKFVAALEFILECYNTDKEDVANRKLRIVLESISEAESDLIYNLFLGKKTEVSKKIYKNAAPFLLQE